MNTSNELTFSAIALVLLFILIGVGIFFFMSRSNKKKSEYLSKRDANDHEDSQESSSQSGGVKTLEKSDSPSSEDYLKSDTQEKEKSSLQKSSADTSVAKKSEDRHSSDTGDSDRLSDADMEELEIVEAGQAVDAPETIASRMVRLRQRLAGSNNILGRSLLNLLSKETLTESDWEEIEEQLLTADLGMEATNELMDSLRTNVKVTGNDSLEEIRKALHKELVAILDHEQDRSLTLEREDDKPAVVLVVGVNGVGKTTTVGKLARIMTSEDKDVVLGAADTFRAAAADQLQTWGAKVGVPTIRSDVDGADPASIAYQAVEAGINKNADVVMIDTAGRLQNKVGLMDELAKVKRVVEKQAELDEVLLVLDATTGQNGLNQAKVFKDAVDIDGIILTKLDGTAKGGIIVSIQRELGVPVKYIGLGEGVDDLTEFNPDDFVEALLEGQENQGDIKDKDSKNKP